MFAAAKECFIQKECLHLCFLGTRMIRLAHGLQDGCGCSSLANTVEVIGVYEKGGRGS